MQIEIFLVTSGIAVALLLFNFIPRTEGTRKIFGAFAGAWLILVGVLLMTTGLHIQSGTVTTIDTNETQLDNDTVHIEGSELVEQTYTEASAGEGQTLQYGFMVGMLYLALGLYILFGNLTAAPTRK